MSMVSAQGIDWSSAPDLAGLVWAHAGVPPAGSPLTLPDIGPYLSDFGVEFKVAITKCRGTCDNKTLHKIYKIKQRDGDAVYDMQCQVCLTDSEISRERADMLVARSRKSIRRLHRERNPVGPRPMPGQKGKRDQLSARTMKRAVARHFR